MFMQQSIILSIILQIILNTRPAQASFLDEPILSWVFRIPGSGVQGGPSFRKGNAILYDDDTATVYATTDDGGLHIIKPDESFAFEPSTVAMSYTECRSGVVISPAGYALYAVIDTPAGLTYVAPDGTTGAGGEITSRILAVNPDGSLRWSVSLLGYVEGTPAIGVNGSKIYVSHNALDQNSIYQGFVTVLASDGSLLERKLRNFDRSGTYGPLSVTVDSAGNDVVIWTDNTDNGYEEQGGHIYMLDQSTEGELEVISFSNFTFSSVTRPTILETGLWIGGHGSTLAAWILDGGIDEAMPIWNMEIQPTERNASQPLVNSPVASNDGFLYVAGNSYDLWCFDSVTGDQVWTDTKGRSNYMAEPRISEVMGDAQVVYAVEALDGKLRQHNATTGERLWEFDCFNVSGVSGCQDSVESEFSLSKDGNIVIYGDIFGRIIALQVADFPTSAPITDQPTVPPTTSIPLTPLPTTSAPTTAEPTTSKPITTIPTTSKPITTIPTTSNPVTTKPTTIAPITAKPITKAPTTGKPMTAKPTTITTAVPVSESNGDVSAAPSTESQTNETTITGPVTIANVTSSPSLSPSSESRGSTGGITSASVQDQGSSGAKDSNVIVSSVIGVAASLIICFIGLFVFQRYKKRSRQSSMLTLVEKASLEGSVEVGFEQRPTSSPREFAAFCQKSESAVLAEVTDSSPSRNSSMKFKKSPSKSKMPTTPSTLASIIETENEDIIEDTSAVGAISDAISPVTRIEEAASDEDSDSSDDGNYKLDDEGFLPRVLSSIFDPVSDEEDDLLNGDENSTSGFLSTSLASMFGRTATSPPPPPPPLLDEDGNSVSTDGSNSSGDSGTSSGSDRGNDKYEPQSHRDDDRRSYIPKKRFIFGASSPPPPPRVEKKKFDPDADDNDSKSSHEDWSIASSSVYVSEDGLQVEHLNSADTGAGSVISENVPVKEIGLWNNILVTLSETEKALGLAQGKVRSMGLRSALEHPDYPVNENVEVCPDKQTSS